MTRTGCDTGFLILWDAQNPAVLKVVDEARNGLRILCFPTPTLAEFLRHLFRQGKSLQSAQRFVWFLSNLPGVSVIPVDIQVALQAAKFAHSFSLPMIDALIFAACLEAGCQEFWTTDRTHFGKLVGAVSRVKVILL
jgi:predicted nucleic acid-binding protein